MWWLKMKIFTDILNFLKSLAFVDYVFFFAVLVLMILVITLFYFIKINDDVLESDKKEKKPKEETQEMQIVKEINEALASEEPRPNIDFTDYEKDQEEKAIISYDELLKQDNNYEINYEKEEYLDDLSVKKFDLDHLVTKKETDEKPVFKGRVISFEKEEAFLQALKQLQNGLQ